MCAAAGDPVLRRDARRQSERSRIALESAITLRGMLYLEADSLKSPPRQGAWSECRWCRWPLLLNKLGLFHSLLRQRKPYRHDPVLQRLRVPRHNSNPGETRHKSSSRAVISVVVFCRGRSVWWPKDEMKTR